MTRSECRACQPSLPRSLATDQVLWHPSEGKHLTMTENDPVVEKGQQQLDQLDEEIEKARRHLKEQTHEDEPTFVDEGTEDREDVDNNIAPPG